MHYKYKNQKRKGDTSYEWNVKWFDTRKGYGFIVGDDGQDYFVHYSQIQADGYKTLHTDERVSFTAGSDASGRPVATCVSAI